MFDMSSLYKMARKTKAAIGIGVAGSSDAVSNSLERAGSEGFARVEVFDMSNDVKPNSLFVSNIRQDRAPAGSEGSFRTSEPISR